MTIKVWNYLKEYENEKQEIHDAIEKVLNSGVLILGGKSSICQCIQRYHMKNNNQLFQLCVIY